METIVSELVDNAISAQKGKAYKSASEILYIAYQVQPENLDFLYFAASNSITAKDYIKALKHYEELKTLNYTGVRTKYFATNKANGEKEPFADKTIRDLSIKSGTHSSPVEINTESKLPEITKNISWIYTNIIGDYNKALIATNEAIKANPDDASLLLTKGNIYYKLGNYDKFKEMMQEIISINPNDVDSYYNIGVISAEHGEIIEARKAYKKVLELDSTYVNAAINLSKTYIDEASQIADKMNALGTTIEDNSKFEAYQKQQADLYKQSSIILEEILISTPNNISILKQLKGLYSFLQEDVKFNIINAKLIELGQ
ncbi:tetratricopeptide repeat protein [Lacinutrix sp.]|uniref:tetratricopeptide repeat protein n=1 Tax=Lacinutrix sp. TaxID=1937692 RepID=UPI0026062929|nr:tetratricopeptide repeat protein [Lacinutrix sp.]MDG1715438.1 tetratricopeptide repeat protein [Lacinutrix sp.]